MPFFKPHFRPERKLTQLELVKMGRQRDGLSLVYGTLVGQWAVAHVIGHMTRTVTIRDLAFTKQFFGLISALNHV
jgi:hypothetical protein